MTSLPSSFRDPSGFVFSHDGAIYRQVNDSFANDYEQFLESGLYDALVSRGLLIPHQDVTDLAIPRTDSCYRVIKPELIPYVSYPYEWSFSQLKDAAMLTLKIQARALKYGFTLKDASAYNVQFVGNKPVFIDTLSFAPYVEGAPWVAYRQFCQHFLAPIALMAKVDVELGKMLVTHIDGIPLSLASKLLPLRTHLNYALKAHIHLHAKIQANYADAADEETSASSRLGKATNARLSSTALRAIIENLAGVLGKLEWNPPRTEWAEYYEHTNYSDQAAEQKRMLVDKYLAGIEGELSVVHDLGANTGEFSRIASKYAQLVVSQDIDPAAVEQNYRHCRAKEPKNILPLVQNLFSPSPAIGWANEERDSFRERLHCDAILALALVHHLAISNNTPLSHIARLFAASATWLVIEFVPKSDSQVVRLLATRDDVFPHYTVEGFEEAFGACFSIERKESVAGSDRLLYLMKSSTKVPA